MLLTTNACLNNQEAVGKEVSINEKEEIQRINPNKDNKQRGFSSSIFEDKTISVLNDVVSFVYKTISVLNEYYCNDVGS